MRERLEERFRALDGVRAPPRWPDLESVEPSGRPARRLGPAERWRRPVAALAALALATAAIGFAVWVFDRDPAPEPAARPTNGKLAFTAYGRPPQPNRGAAYAVDPDGTDLFRLSGSSGPPAFDVVSVVWSPDGRYLLLERPGHARRVRLLDPATETETPLASLRGVSFVRDGWGVAWSPDGRSLAYSAESSEQRYGPNGSSLFVSTISGGPDREITAGPADVAAEWSPDGRSIVFARYGHARYIGFDCDRSQDGIEYGLHVVPALGGNEFRLTGDGCDAAPDWSPDGRTIAFIRRDTTIASIPAAGGHVQGLFEYDADPGCRDRGGESHRGREPAAVHDLSWSPDGRWLAFVGDDCLYTMRSDGTDLRLVVGPESGLFVMSVDWGTAPATEEPALPEPTSSPSASRSGEGAAPFRPATYQEGDRTVMPVTFPDGTTAEFVFRPDLDLASLDVAPNAQLYGSDVCGYDLIVTRRDPIEEIVEGAPLAMYEGADGRSVGLWRGRPSFEPYDYMWFRFGSWNVLVPCRLANPSGRADDFALLARSLDGREAGDGFLFLEATGPIRLPTNREQGGPALLFSSPDVVLDLTVGSGRCASDYADKSPGDGVVQWCIQSDGRVWLYASSFQPSGRDLLRALVEGLVVRSVFPAA